MERTPNILIIVVDQQRYDCIGYSNDYPVRTPHVDRLAREGVWFSQAYTPIPVCGPARQSFLCGKRPESFGALWNFDYGLPVGALDPAAYAWPRELQAAGYQTGHLGKWGVHPRYDPTHYGYDRHVGEGDYRDFVARRHPGVTAGSSYFGERDTLPLEDARTHWMARQASGMIRDFARSDRPWHVRLDFPEPHLPCRPAGPFADMYAPQDVPEWRSFADALANKPYIQRQQLLNWGVEHFSWQDWAPIVARYYGAISQVDDAIGRVLRTLVEEGVEQDTIVVFTADHGDMCGGHRMMDKHFILYDDVVKVPFAVKWPGHIAPGQVCDDFVYSFLDLPPTILEWLGLHIPREFHGRSLASLLGGTASRGPRDAVVSTYNGQQFGLYTQRMIRTRKLKYVWNTTDMDELYDLTTDPDELVNVVHDPQYGEALKDLRRRLYEELLDVGDGLVGNSWTRDQLLQGRKL